MESKVFTEAVKRTMREPTFEVIERLKKHAYALNMVMGAAGEAGELVDYYKKHIFSSHELNPVHVIKELGDILFYVAACAEVLGVPLEHVMEKNTQKLLKRHPSGYSDADSIARKDVET
jgi:NTP pyrophosphatase (non-canonical NTP hydrolase)